MSLGFQDFGLVWPARSGPDGWLTGYWNSCLFGGPQEDRRNIFCPADEQEPALDVPSFWLSFGKCALSAPIIVPMLTSVRH